MQNVCTEAAMVGRPMLKVVQSKQIRQAIWCLSHSDCDYWESLLMMGVLESYIQHQRTVVCKATQRGGV